jgi:acetyl esterase
MNEPRYDKLDPAMAAWLKEWNASSLATRDPRTAPVADQRFAADRRHLNNGGALLRVRKIEDVEIPTRSGVRLAARIYRPVEGFDPRPCVLYLHGGGWVVGSLSSHDNLCRHLSTRSGATVVSLDYRMAPEHPAPAAFEDTIDAFTYLCSINKKEEGDAEREALKTTDPFAVY